MKRALLIKNREYNGICIDFVLAKLMGNRDSIENHRQSRIAIIRTVWLPDGYTVLYGRYKRSSNCMVTIYTQSREEGTRY